MYAFRFFFSFVLFCERSSRFLFFTATLWLVEGKSDTFPSVRSVISSLGNSYATFLYAWFPLRQLCKLHFNLYLFAQLGNATFATSVTVRFLEHQDRQRGGVTYILTVSLISLSLVFLLLSTAFSACY